MKKEDREQRAKEAEKILISKFLRLKGIGTGELRFGTTCQQRVFHQSVHMT